MRIIYKNPKELGSCLRANEERVFKNGGIEIKISNILGEDRKAIIEDIVKDF